MEDETQYLITLGVISIWIAALTDTFFIGIWRFAKRIWQAKKGAKDKTAHCLNCAALKLRKQYHVERKR